MKRTQLWILYGLAAGLLTGLLANIVTAPEAPAEALRPQLQFVAEEVMNPLGKIFLRLLFLTVLPLVFSSLALGVHELRDFRELGKIGLKTLAFTLFLTTVSVGIGLALVNVVEPGKRLDDSSRARLLADIEKDPTGIPAAGRDDRPLLERVVTAIIRGTPWRRQPMPSTAT